MEEMNIKSITGYKLIESDQDPEYLYLKGVRVGMKPLPFIKRGGGRLIVKQTIRIKNDKDQNHNR